MSASDERDDVDLTNLNWVAGAPVPLPNNFSMSPPEYKSPIKTVRNQSSPCTSFRGCGPTSTTGSPASQCHSRPVEIVVTSPWRKDNVATSQACSVTQSSNPTTPLRCGYHDNETECQKPNCSYTCLIGMALRASSGTNGCLPVNEIYKYIEKEFPYFKTAPDGWKNSVRHNLSLNTAFRKVTRNDGWQGKKGFFWEIAPEKKEIVDSEVDTFLKSTGRELQPHSTLLTSPIKPTLKQVKLPVTQQSIPCKVPKIAPSKTPPDIHQYSPQIQSQIVASQMELNPKLSPTEREFDMSNTPSEYIGLEAPSTDIDESARELFGLDTTPVTKNHQQPSGQCSPSGSSDGPLFPLYTSIPPYYGAVYGYPVPIASSSPGPLVDLSRPSPFLSQYFPPQYVQYVHNDMTGIIYGPPTVGNQMIFEMGYNAPILNEGKGMEVEDSVNYNGEKCVEDFGSAKSKRVHKIKTPSTPTSHYASGNGYVPKRRRLNDYQESTSIPQVHLTDTGNQEVDMEAILQEFVRESRNTNPESKCETSQGESTVTADGLSDHQKDQMVQITGIYDLETLLQSGMDSFSTSNTPGEEKTIDCAQTFINDSTRTSTLPDIHFLHEAGNHHNAAIHEFPCEENPDVMMSSESPLGAEKITVEIYRG